MTGLIALQMPLIRLYDCQMDKLLRLIASLCLFITPPVFAEGSGIGEGDAAALQVALNRGLALRNYDQAAWHTTDTLREDVKDLNGSGIQGWVVTETEDGWLSTFWKPDGDSFAGVYSAEWDGKKVKNRKVLVGESTALTAAQIGLIRAQQAVGDAQPKIERCSEAPFNSVILPPESDDDPILVYYLVPQTSNDAIPMGKHYRFEVRDNKVVNQRSFTNSCIALELTDGKGKGKLEALVITHLLDPVPTEIHVFSVFAAEVPIYVSTASNKFTWAVEVSSGQPRVRKVE